MTDIGRAGMVMKGDYNSASTYETLDAVSYNNGLYVAKQNVPAGTVPTNTTYWQCAIDTTSFLPTKANVLNGIVTGAQTPITIPSGASIGIAFFGGDNSSAIALFWEYAGYNVYWIKSDANAATFDATNAAFLVNLLVRYCIMY